MENPCILPLIDSQYALVSNLIILSGNLIQNFDDIILPKSLNGIHTKPSFKLGTMVLTKWTRSCWPGPVFSKLRNFSTLRSFPRKSSQSWVEKLRISTLYSRLKVQNFLISTLSLFLVSKEILSNLRSVSKCCFGTIFSWEVVQISLTGFGVSQLWENVYNDYFLLISLIFWIL